MLNDIYFPCLVLGNAQQSHATTGKHSEGTPKSESYGKHSNPCTR